MSRARIVPAAARTTCLLAVLLFSGCVSTPKEAPGPGEETPITVKEPVSRKGSGVAEEIRVLVEKGTPPSLLRALDVIRSRDLTETEYGRAMTAAAVALMKNLYPEIPADLPVSDPPPAHSYTRILRDAEKSSYTPASPLSTDYLEYVLPFLALLGETRTERFASAEQDLARAATLSTDSVLDPWFRALSAERRGKKEEALALYLEATGRSADCYPASVGASRVLSSLGRSDEALSLLTELLTRYPDNLLVKRELARLYYRKGDWSRAGPAVAEILQRDSKDTAFLLMRSHILVEQGFFLQAQPLLDMVAASDSSGRLYLFLRARIQAEGYKNSDSALTYLRSLLRSWPEDEEALAYAARIMMDSSRDTERKEGRELLSRLLSRPVLSISTSELAMKDAMNRQAWIEAEKYLQSLLATRRSVADLKSACKIYTALKNRSETLVLARELYERNSSDGESSGILVEALIAAGNRSEASRFIDEHLAEVETGSPRSRFFYLRSRLRDSDDAVMADLRSSLFEDPRNLDSLIAMFELYRSKKEERRAVYYLKQALAISPDNPLLRRYRLEFAEALGSSF